MATSVQQYVYHDLTLPRWGATIPCAQEGRSTLFLPVRAVCALIGVDIPTQTTILKHDPRYELYLRHIPLLTEAGWRNNTLWLRRPEVALWIGGIDARRCALAARGTLADFQADLARAADNVLMHVAPTVGEGERGLVTATSVRFEAHGSCPDCGAPLQVLYEDGVTTLLRGQWGGEGRALPVGGGEES